MSEVREFNPNSVMKLGRVIPTAKRIIDLDLESFSMRSVDD